MLLSYYPFKKLYVFAKVLKKNDTASYNLIIMVFVADMVLLVANTYRMVKNMRLSAELSL